jgi:hypothetical protein
MRKIMRTLATMAIAVVATAMALTACKKEDPVPVISIRSQITSPPGTLIEGSITGSLAVSATATEGATLAYQWYTNTTESNTGGSKIDGATNASYTLPTDLMAGTYYYFCEVSAERAASVRSQVATVTVNVRPVPVITITTQPTVPTGLVEGSIPAGTNLTVAATVTLGATLSYQWYTRNPPTDEAYTAIEGATEATYTLPADLVAGVHRYYCVVNASDATPVDSDRVAVTVTPQAADIAKLSGKWDVGDNSLGIVSVEFGGSNNYVIVTNTELNTRAGDDEYFSYFGTYTVCGDEVTLSDLGTLTVTSLVDNDIAFSLSISGGEAYSMSGDKVQEMPSTTKTDLLCRTWRIVSFEPEYEEEDGEEVPEFAYFSKAGTYLVSYSDGSSMLSNWRWRSESEGTIDYSHEHPPVWDGYFATIKEIDESTMVVDESEGDDLLRTFLEAVE